MRFRSQSPMEYLLTYGWMLIIVAVAIGALYAFGIFSGGLQGANTCIASPQFICSSPILYSSGALTAKIGQAGTQTMIINGLACTNTTTNPVVPSPTSITLNAGQIQNLTFGCPVPSNSIGTRFSGYLWIFYTLPNLQTVTQQVKVATVKVTVSSTSFITNPIVFANVSITLINSQSSSTGSNFQQVISFNPSSYAAYESNDLGNIRFYSGATELDSWCQSGCSSGAGTSTFWIKLPSGVSANSNAIVNMEFLSKTTEYDGIYAGEAPNATSTYAQFDNGASVFTYYDNFAGNTLSSSYTQLFNSNFGASPLYASNGITLGCPTSASDSGFLYNSGFTPPFIFDSYITRADYAIGIAITNSISASGGGYSLSTWGGSVACEIAGGLSCGSGTSLQLGLGVMGGAWYSSSAQTWYESYTATSGSGSAFTLPSQEYIGMMCIEGSPGRIITANWMRVRAYPPSGVAHNNLWWDYFIKE
jgi:hypothetical protein